MKPHELLNALMLRDKLGPLPLAKRIGKPRLQSQIQRFRDGDVREPKRTTVAPIARFFGLPVDAFYDEKTATEVAARLGLKVEPIPKQARQRRPRTTRPESIMELIAALPEAQKQEFHRLFDPHHKIAVELTEARIHAAQEFRWHAPDEPTKAKKTGSK